MLNTSTYKQLTKMGYISPHKDTDSRYVKLAEYCDKHGIVLKVQKDVDLKKDLVPDNHELVNLLQTRPSNTNNDKVERLMVDLKHNPLKRPPWGVRTQAGLIARLVGFHRTDAKKALGQLCDMLMASPENGKYDNKFFLHLNRLSHLSNRPDAQDVESLSPEDIRDGYRATAELLAHTKGWKRPLDPEQVAELKRELKEEIRSVHEYLDERRIGRDVNAIVDEFREEENKQYAVPVSIADSISERDDYINETFQNFWPRNVWDTKNSCNGSLEQIFVDSDCFANFEQGLLKKCMNLEFLDTKDEAWVCHWIQCTQGQMRQDTIEKKRQTKLDQYSELNLNEVYTPRWDCPQITRVLFPASFAGEENYAYQWNKQFRRWDRVEEIHKVI